MANITTSQMARRHINDDVASLHNTTNDNASIETITDDANTLDIADSNTSTTRTQDESSSSSRGQSAASTTRGASATTNGVRPKPNEAPLPPGWDFSYSDKGRMFFIDHANKTTSWIDPRTGKPSPQPSLDFESRIGPLPAGWEERRHHDGRIFYIDHNRKHTQWEDPRLQKFAGPAVPYSRDYKHKFDTFRKLLPPPPPKGSQFGGVDKYFIRVKRTNVLEDSYNKIMHEKNADLLRMPLWIEFEGEKSYDYGGVSREW